MNEHPISLADKFVIRLPDGWRSVIKSQAQSERTSMNSVLLNAIETAMRIKGVKLDATEQK